MNEPAVLDTPLSGARPNNRSNMVTRRLRRSRVLVAALIVFALLGNAVQTVTANAGPAGQPVELWRYETGATCFNVNAVIGDNVYATYCAEFGERGLRALDAASGAVRWEFTGNDAWVAGVIDGLVYVTSVNPLRGLSPGGTNELYALDVDTGVERWHYSLTDDGTTTHGVVIDNGVLAAGLYESALVGIDLATGQERWSIDMSDQGAIWAEAAADGIVYVPSEMGSLFAVDIVTGKERWRAELSALPIQGVAIADGLVAAATTNGSFFGSLLALDTENGKELWQSDKPMSAPVVSDGVGYASNDAGTVYAFDLATGDELWQFQADPGEELSQVPVGTGHVILAAAGGIVYQSRSFQSEIHALDASTGTELWSFDAGGPIFTWTVASDGVLYFTTGTGDLIAVGVAKDAATLTS